MGKLFVNSAEFGGGRDRPLAKNLALRGVILLGCSLSSLILSCILWSSHKQAWMDEILTWKADGGMPLFYTTAWVWAKTFGTGVLTLRLYSCIYRVRRLSSHLENDASVLRPVGNRLRRPRSVGHFGPGAQKRDPGLIRSIMENSRLGDTPGWDDARRKEHSD